MTVPLVLHFEDDELVFGVGPGVGLKFAGAYFPLAHQVLRIASAYFSLKGYQIIRKYLTPEVTVHVLVGRDQGSHVQQTVMSEALADLGQCEQGIHDAVVDLVERIKRRRFVIRDAREMQTAFHAKFYISDNSVFWHGSVNFSWNGLRDQSEQASRVTDPVQIQKLANWYDDAALGAKDLLEELTGRLERWLNLDPPFNIYLKMLMLLSDMPDFALRPEAHAPTYFQKGVIAQALGQIASWGGALLVVATGLGKTVIGAEVALRLMDKGMVKRLILITPHGVRDNWMAELEGRYISTNKVFNTSVLFQKDSAVSHHQVTLLVRELKQANSDTIIIIDEAHFYRNQLSLEHLEDRRSLVNERLVSAVGAGAKIVLLTATAYGTSNENFNSLLYLLPHRALQSPEGDGRWSAPDPSGLALLPVVTILGLPHVLKLAQGRGDVDENGRVFFRMSDEVRYLPKSLRLYAPRYLLPLQNEIQDAFDQHCFDAARKVPHQYFDDETQQRRKGGSDAVYRTALMSWLGSPRAMIENIQQNVKTSGRSEAASVDGVDGELPTGQTQPAQERGASMRLNLGQRSIHLGPLVQKLESVTQDDKLSKLQEIVSKHCLGGHRKLIVFVDRHFTARFVHEQMVQIFGGELSFGCTVTSGSADPTLKNIIQRTEELKKFAPRANDHATDKEHDVLICTDADGVGVNLQDADVLVHYDPPEAADALFQRVGRVLRMTADPERILHIYTLVPSMVDEQGTTSAVQKSVRQVFSRLTQRHDKSKRILGSGIMSQVEVIEITLDDPLDVKELARDGELLKEVGGIGTASRLRHVAALEQHRAQAVGLPDYLLSVRAYPHEHSRVFVMLKHGQRYRPVLFNTDKQKLEEATDWQILDFLVCDPAEPIAAISTATIEALAQQTARLWCEQENIALDQVINICAIYLIPAGRAKIKDELLKVAGLGQGKSAEGVTVKKK